MKLKYGAISKVLPCVYDDSLSYYEVLCKVRDKLNEVIDVDNAQSDAINDLGEQSAERYNEFEQRILHDLEEMENKLEGEISSGDDAVLQTLSELIANLSNEIDDVSASVSGIESSVADAMQTANQASEAVNELSGDVETVTQNVADLSTAMNNVDGSLQQLNRNVNANTDAIEGNTNAISALGERVTDIEDEISGGMVFADVDSNLSTTSTNPVENQAITRKIQQVEGDIPSQLDDLSDVSFSNPSAGQIAGFDSNGNLVNMNAPAGVTVVDNLNSTSSTDALSANMGKNLKDQIDALPTPPSVIDNLTSTSTTEALSANQGKNLKDQIDALPTPPAVIDNLTSSSTTDALSANQGKNLKDQIDALPAPVNVIDSLNSSSTSDALSANQGRVLAQMIQSASIDISEINSDPDVPLNHLLWLEDYKQYNTSSFVYNDKSKLHELYLDYNLSMNDNDIFEEALDYIISLNAEIGFAVQHVYGVNADLSAFETVSDIENNFNISLYPDLMNKIGIYGSRNARNIFGLMGFEAGDIITVSGSRFFVSNINEESTLARVIYCGTIATQQYYNAFAELTTHTDTTPYVALNTKYNVSNLAIASMDETYNKFGSTNANLIELVNSATNNDSNKQAWTSTTKSGYSNLKETLSTDGTTVIVSTGNYGGSPVNKYGALSAFTISLRS